MTFEQRLISAGESDEDIADKAIRPRFLKDYTGQPVVREQMEIFIEAARKRKES